jgi:hypothetical protein
MALNYDYGGRGEYEDTTPEELAAIVAGSTSTTPTTPSAADKLAQQILAQNLTNNWKGEGFGSAQANAQDMAKILAGLDITDINQFGQITKSGIDTAVTPQYEYTDEGAKIIGYVDQTGKPVDSSLVKTEFVPGSSENDSGGVAYVAPVGTATAFGNKVTGKEVPNTYGEFQKDNAWGGTFTGEGNTGYRVRFDAQGNPQFYTTGGSSNTLVNMLAGDPILTAAANALAAYVGGPWGTAALQAAMGKDPTDIAKATALSYLGSQAAGAVSGSTDLVDAVGKTTADALGRTAGQFVAGEGKIDLEKLLLNQGVGAATNAVLGEIPGFTDLDASTKKLVTKAVTSAINSGGNLSSQQIMNLAITAGMDAAKYAPMSQEDIDSLEPGARAAYDEGGTKGYLDYKRAIRNMTGLTTSGRTGDDMGGNVDAEVSSEVGRGIDNDIIYNLENAGLTDTTKADDKTVLIDALKNANKDAIDLDTLDKAKDKPATDLGKVTVTGKKECPDGQHWDEVLGKCVMDAGEVDVKDTKTTALDKVDDTTKTTEDKTETLKCAEGFTPNEDGTACIPVTTIVGKKDPCGPGTVLNPETGECDVVEKEENPCADGFHLEDGLCVPDDDIKDPDECPEGYVRNLETGACEKVETSVVKPPVVKPPVVQPPPVVKKTGVPVEAPTTGIYTANDKIEPIYAEGMDDFDLFATLQELLAEDSKKDKKKDNKKSKDKTKMATGGHLDDLLAEQMTVDDLLKLLR